EPGCDTYPHFQNYWKQSIVQSIAAGIIAERMNPDQFEEYSLSGLLLDIGRLALLTCFRDEYLPIVETSIERGTPLDRLESDWLGIQHTEIGARLMQQWRLPIPIIEAIRWHHASPEWLLERREEPNFATLSAMAVSACVGDFVCSTAREPARERLCHLTRDVFHWTLDESQELLCETEIRAKQFETVVDSSTGHSSSDLLMDANDQLVQMTLRAQSACNQATARQQVAEQETRDLEFQNQQLQKQALHDPLTGVYNRQFFDEMLENESKRCQRCATPVGVIFADVDHFKDVNDTYGHQIGDQVLKQIVRLFASTIRNSDVLARFGGEEFVILVNQPTEKGLLRLAERIRRRVEAEVIVFGGVRIPVTVSLGAAMAVPGRNDRDLGTRLISTADECLYEAKRAGRNRCRMRSLVDERERVLLHQVLQHRFSRWLVANRRLDIPSVSKALLDCRGEPARVGDLALECGYLDQDQVKHIIENQDQTGERFGFAAVRLGWITEEQLVHLLSLQQENPKQLAEALIRQGLMAPHKVAEALDEYLKSEMPKRRVPSNRATATSPT
ncbi:MAG: diguanylate cyclase, partial [Planctomycetes bacterium]|nr:diguanylate cyclase [Planctomycetota bacterium]